MKPENDLINMLKVSDRQLGIIREALELYDRLLMGQIDSELRSLFAFKKDFDREKLQSLCREIKSLIFPELRWNEYYGVGWDDTLRQQNSQIAYEMEAMIRHSLWKRRQVEGKKESYTTSAYLPLHYSDQPFIKLEKEEPPFTPEKSGSPETK